jgi:colicin import membrane protein
MPAISQNVSQNTSEKADEQAERNRIKSERAKLNESLAQQRQACYQKLAVTPCLNEARDQHNEKMRDLKRQEVALNDVQRKRAAADRVKALDQRNSPEAQLKRAQDRGKAMQDATKREESRASRQASREAKQAEAEKAPKAAKEPKPEGIAPAPQGKPRQQPVAKVAPDQRPGQAAKMEKSRQQAAEREKDAAERKAKAAEREAKRKKPPAAGLPMPAEAK